MGIKGGEAKETNYIVVSNTNVNVSIFIKKNVEDDTGTSLGTAVAMSGLSSRRHQHHLSRYFSACSIRSK